ncbi:catalase [Anaerofilum sp. BX8]|uniref:Catalase n=1 Tax=Anaerofilum hominis TaxID=2763016 RepID=A0A923I8F1_9FIRM|nr:DUF5662 family protein [Anaerofilum hominis]MBC5581749.1 catalase [Anaerofilum hominis]
MNFWGHLSTINHHKRLVLRYCFKLGLYRQGLCHDLSKYSPAEFWAGVKYFQGDHSPNEAEREEKGYSAAWLHHKGRNKHHLEYWIDYAPGAQHAMAGMRMPERYVAEMVCDRIAASRTYLKDAYTDRAPWEYYERSRSHYLLHPETRALLERLLVMLRDEGEDKTFAFLRTEVLKKR